LGIFDKIRSRQEDGEESEMSFLDHLEELRWHLIRSAVIVLVGMIFIFVNIKAVTDKIILAPYAPDFPTYTYLCQIDESVCMRLNQATKDANGNTLLSSDNIILQATDPSEQFTRAIMIAMIGGLVMAFPYLIFELWRFVKPGLSPEERRGTTGFIIYTSLLFFTGILFAYFIVSPMTIVFLANFSISDQVVQIWKLGDVISLVVMLCLAGGLLFEMPMLAFFLAKLGIVNAQFLSHYRRHSIVIMFVVAGILTPSPDIFTQISVAVPLIILYEISIVVVRSVARNQAKALANANAES
jgi:sec-independent protein translocase protein TatC